MQDAGFARELAVWRPRTGGRITPRLESSSTLNAVEIIARKRDGAELSDAEIGWLIREFSFDRLPDYQMSAMAMAVFLQGMTAAETASLTRHMLESGVSLQPTPGGSRVDKHSTGGVGDKVSLILAPLLACCDLQVPMISGRGLGATGGTLDKLEAIPGFRTDLSIAEFDSVLESVGCVISGASDDLAPADRKLYALRDVTATVPSIPLITASIMSKKLAESLDALILDVKVGSGAFMKSPEQARQLAESLVSTGARNGVRTTALLTDMSQPLGQMCGNAVEVRESLDFLAGRTVADDLRELTLSLCAELLVLSGRAPAAPDARRELENQIGSGRAFERFQQMVAAQGGDPDAPLNIAPPNELPADRSGTVTTINTEQLGLAVIDMGGGRRVKSDRVDPAVGLEMLVRIGDRVQPGQPLLRIFSEQPDRVVPRLRAAIEIRDAECPIPELILSRVTPGNNDE